MAVDACLEATTSILHGLATDVNLNRSPSEIIKDIKLPGPESAAKLALEQEIADLVTRVRTLELNARASVTQNLPDTPNEASENFDGDIEDESPPQSSSKSTTSRQQLVNSLLNSRDGGADRRPQRFTKLSEEELEALREHVENQSKLLDSQKSELAGVNAQLIEQKQLQEQALNVLEVERVAILERELKKHQQANEAFQKALREIGYIVTAVANGDLSKKVEIHSVEMDPEITTFKRVR